MNVFLMIIGAILLIGGAVEQFTPDVIIEEKTHIKEYEDGELMRYSVHQSGNVTIIKDARYTIHSKEMIKE